MRPRWLKKTIRFSTLFQRKHGTDGSSAQRVWSIICRETGHGPNKCPKVTKKNANLALSDQAGLVADAETVGVSFWWFEGTERLDWEIRMIETWIVDSAATRRITPNPLLSTSYRECDGVVRGADGVALPIESACNILRSFQLYTGHNDLTLLGVSFVPILSRNLLLSSSHAVPVTQTSAMVTEKPCSARQADYSLSPMID